MEASAHVCRKLPHVETQVDDYSASQGGVVEKAGNASGEPPPMCWVAALLPRQPYSCIFNEADRARGADVTARPIAQGHEWNTNCPNATAVLARFPAAPDLVSPGGGPSQLPSQPLPMPGTPARAPAHLAPSLRPADRLERFGYTPRWKLRGVLARVWLSGDGL